MDFLLTLVGDWNFVLSGIWHKIKQDNIGSIYF